MEYNEYKLFIAYITFKGKIIIWEWRIMKIYSGSIISCDEKNTVYKYLAEDNGRIAFVGDELPESFKNNQIIELGDKALLPSFADTHIHFASFSLFNSGLNVMDARSNEEIQEMISGYMQKTKAKIIIVFGASPHSVKEKKLISRSELDKVSKDRPIFIVKYDGHACIINQALINMLDDNIKALRGFNAQTGEMNQEAFFKITDFVTGSVSTMDMVRGMQHGIDAMAAKGIGMMNTVSSVGFPKDLDVDMERWVGRGAQGGYQTRLFFQTMDTDKVTKRKLPRIGGCFVTALDGCYGSVDAALLKPYEGTDSRGVLYYTDEKVTEFCKKANRLGLQIELHAIGDAAFNQAAKALKAALDDYPRKDHRHGIIHACLPTEEGMKICAEYGIQIPLQTAFIIWPQEPDWYLRSILGDREAKLNPLRTFIDMGIKFSAGSDAPCTSPDPVIWIHNACNHPVKEQSLTVFEALRMCTYYGYWTTFDEKDRGTLENGKIADMVILSQNPYEVPVEKLNTLKVEQLILGGEKYKNQSQSIAKLMLKGMLSKNKI